MARGPKTTEQEVSQAISLKSEGKKVKEIAEQMKRSRSWVSRVIAHHAPAPSHAESPDSSAASSGLSATTEQPA